MNCSPQNRSPCQTSRLHREVLVGGAVGMVAGAVFAYQFGAAAGMVVFAILLGCATGAVIGVLLWVSTAEFPEAAIPPLSKTPPSAGATAAPREKTPD